MKTPPSRDASTTIRSLRFDCGRTDAGFGATGTLYVGAGAAVARWPYRIARSSERLDSRGSTRDWSEVEPSGWTVAGTRAVGSTDSWSEVEPTLVVVRFTRILAVLAVLFGLPGVVGTLLG